MNLQPLGDRLIVEVLDEEETTISGIVLPDTAKEKPQRGRILAVGPGARDEKGEYIKMDVAELLDGDRLDAGLLGHLPERRSLRALAGADQALRQRPGAVRLASGTNRRKDPSASQPPNDHPASRKLTAHHHFVTDCCEALAKGRETSLECPGTPTRRVPIGVTKSSEEEEAG